MLREPSGLRRSAARSYRRSLLGTGLPLSEIAYACGFRDYANFARKFRYGLVIRLERTADISTLVKAAVAE